MNNCSFLLTCFMALSVVQSLGQSSVQYRLDTTAAETDPIIGTCVGVDGGTLFLMQTVAGQVLWKGASDGTPEWARAMDPILERPQMEARSNGGLLIGEDLGAEHFGVPGGFDTIVQHIALTALSDAGELTWRTSFSITIPGFTQWTNPLNSLEVAEDPSGAIFVFASRNFDGSISQVAFVFKFSSEGDLLWSRQVGEDLSTAGVYWNHSDGDKLEFKPDGSGGGYFMAHTSHPPAHLLHIDTNGALDWSIGYTYENDYQSFLLSNIVVDDDGNAVLAGKLNVPIGGLYSMVIRIDPAGELVDADLYAWSNASLDLSGMFRTSEDHIMMWWVGYFLEIDVSGTITWTKRIEGTTVAPHAFAFYPRTADRIADRLVLPGNMNITHQIFGYQNNQPQVWSFNPEQLDGCLIGDFDMVQYDLPDSLVLLTPDPSIGVVVEASVTMESSPSGSAPIATIGTSPVCPMFVGLPEVEILPPLLLLGSNLVQQGEVVSIQSHATVNFAVINSAGATIDRIARTGDISRIETADLSPGLYLVIGYDARGGPVGSSKVVVQ